MGGFLREPAGADNHFGRGRKSKDFQTHQGGLSRPGRPGRRRAGTGKRPRLINGANIRAKRPERFPFPAPVALAPQAEISVKPAGNKEKSGGFIGAYLCEQHSGEFSGRNGQDMTMAMHGADAKGGLAVRMRARGPRQARPSSSRALLLLSCP